MKKNILIIFGGKSGEHEVSTRSAQSIEKYIDKNKFNTRVLGISHHGQWHYGNSIAEISDGLKVLPMQSNLALPASDKSKNLSLKTESGLQPLKADVIFPIIHGTNGEDGRLQGLLEMANLPYVGPEVLGSAVCMDKVIQKQICANFKIPQTKFIYFTKHEFKQNKTKIINNIKNNLKLPLFVKPANMGSSVGVSKVKNLKNLNQAINLAFEFDHKIIIEQAINNILEIEVSVLGNHQPEASVCGSIKPNTEFYDYQTKYITDDIEAEIPAQIPADISDQIRQTAVKAFKALNCFGLARVDFLYQPETKKFYLNELNTLPGFTSTSMYPKLWEATGLSYTDLISKLIGLAQKRWQEKQELKYHLSLPG